ncbi:MAG: alpha/beta hydrolase [Bryobacteraceae bacterium]|nr:alpha/beta hydrolase [Bryobacteraceae bacterium]
MIRAGMVCLMAATLWGEESLAWHLRGQPQEVTLYRATGPAKGAVLFLPGDGGWRGFAIDMARSLSKNGFDVYGWDVKQYLTGFTASQGPLSEKQMQADVEAMTQQVGVPKVVLIGWSQGAAMALLGAAAKGRAAGVVLLGLPETAVRGWRFADNLTYLTKAEPNEPTFATAPWMEHVAPARLVMIQSTADEYVPLAAAKALFARAREPKHFFAVTARNHRYSGNQEEFLRILARETDWAGGAP